MSNNQEPSNVSTFAGKYPLPDDGLAFEFELRDRYAHELPESASLLYGFISRIQAVTGMSPDVYHIADESQKEQVVRTGLENDDGHIVLRPSWSSVTVRHGKRGDLVKGDLPPETAALAEDIFSLTGAELVRDDRAEGEERGITVRKGEYQGVPFYIINRYRPPVGQESAPVQSFAVVDEPKGIEILNELSESQRKEFVEMSGINPYEWIEHVVAHDVDRNNYRQVAHILRQTKEAVDSGHSVTP